MAFVNNQELANAPMVSENTATSQVATTGGGVQNHLWGSATATPLIPFDGSYLILANDSADNVWVSSTSGTRGIQVSPGATFEVALAKRGNLYVQRDAAGAGTVTCMLFA